MKELDPILADITDYLRYRIENGEKTIELSPDALADLPEKPSVSQPLSPAAASSRAKPAPRRATATGAESSDAGRSRLETIAGQVESCQRCPLHAERNKTVPGQGSTRPDILFVGEGPGADEDRQGIPFVGRAGKLLTRMIEAMGYTREEVFIANIVKCRPPLNRKPLPEEMQACMPYLQEQITLLKPKVILCLGATAVKGLLGTRTGISRLRGNWTQYEGIPVMPTYHPAYLQRYPAAKRDTWADLKKVLLKLGKPIPEKKKSKENHEESVPKHSRHHIG